MIVRVAAGVLQRPDGRILLAQRPKGKIAAGRWEFPGGKIEQGEAALQALKRELQEEIGVTDIQARPLICLRHAYTERTVELDTWLVTSWRGEARGLENQALAWTSLDEVENYDILEADAPILTALRLPPQLPVTGPFTTEEALIRRACALAEAGHRLLRFRAPALEDVQYVRLAGQLAAQLARRNAALLVDRIGMNLVQDGIAGLHLRSTDLRALATHPDPGAGLLLASVHDETDIQKAQELGVDALVLGPVCPTASHPGAETLGWARFSQLLKAAHLPVYAIGGVGPDELLHAQHHGAQGIAAIRAYW